MEEEFDDIEEFEDYVTEPNEFLLAVQTNLDRLTNTENPQYNQTVTDQAYSFIKGHVDDYERYLTFPEATDEMKTHIRSSLSLGNNLLQALSLVATEKPNKLARKGGRKTRKGRRSRRSRSRRSRRSKRK